MNIGTPNNIDVLLHYHVSPRIHDRYDAPAVLGAIAMLLDAGALEYDLVENEKWEVGRYKTTPLGKAWVKALCRVNIPTLAYLDEHGNVL